MIDEHGNPAAASAQRRLAQTRAELADLMLPRQARTAAFEQQRAAMQARVRREAVADWVGDAEPAPPGRHAPRPTASAAARPTMAAASFGWAALLRRGASIWWRHHPAHAALEVADSALHHVALRKPLLMLGVAAGAGAVVVLARPWRLVSVTALGLALLRMSDVRSAFGSLVRGE